MISLLSAPGRKCNWLMSLRMVCFPFVDFMKMAPLVTCLIVMFLHFVIVGMSHDHVRVFAMCYSSLTCCFVTNSLSFLTPMNLMFVTHSLICSFEHQRATCCHNFEHQLVLCLLLICWFHEDDEDPNLQLTSLHMVCFWFFYHAHMLYFDEHLSY